MTDFSNRFLNTLNAQRGQSLQEYGLIAGLVVIVAIGSLSAIGQTNQSLMQQNTNGLFGQNQDGPVQKLASLLESPQTSGRESSLASSISNFQFQGTQGNYQFSVDPGTGYYQVNQSTNTTSAEGLNNLFDFTRDASGLLKQLAATGKLPDGTPLSQEERAALSQLSAAGFGLNGAQLWLGGTREKLGEMGIDPGWGFADGQVNDRSYAAWGFTHAGYGEELVGPEDHKIMDGLVHRYQSFQETFKQVAPILGKNETLKNTISPIIGAIDQVSRKQFYGDPTNFGNSSYAFEYVTSKLSPALDIRGPVANNTQTDMSATPMSNAQAIDFTYQASQEFKQASGSAGGTPTLNELIASATKS